ncbi:helix-turn-helix domain-containing protein [Paenibacillus qinlingensis]|uniref:AraC-like DNA-binding protein n=1 Tax=Paenibacillus qinlingensis TaxID=1837343 RepID=A0ABU1NWB5_9BACL|nr:helix-turn-helix domain-containing protein [Paenibacillus qinlingensis]MDR6551755.1 AraC-like DNA-binding protein [Paenibacillus qinlingensis]
MRHLWRALFATMREGKKKRLSFTRLILWMYVVALVPILTMSVISYIQVSQTFRSEAEQTSQQYVGQTINALEIIVEQIMDTCRQLTLNTTFRRFEIFPQGDYFENLTGEIPPDDLQESYRYYVEKSRAMDSISMFMLSSQFIDSLYFFDSGQNKVLAFGDRSAAGTFFLFDQFYDQDWRPSLKKQELPAPVILDSRRAKTRDGSFKHVLTVIMPTGVGDNAFVVNLNEKLMYKEVLNRLSGSGRVYLLSNKGQIQLHETDDAQSPAVDSYLGKETEQIEYGKNGSFNLSIADVPSLAIYASSQWLGWTVLHVVPLEGLDRSLNFLRQVIIYIGLIMLLIAGLMAYMSSKRLYRPVKETMEERDLYRLRWEESLPVYKERFVYSLLRPNKYSLEEIQSKLAQLKIPLGPGPYEVMVVEMKTQRSGESEGTLEADFHRIQVRELVETATAGFEGFSVWVDEVQMARVFSGSSAAENGEVSIAQVVSDRLREASPEALTVGYGGGCAEISDLPQAYTMAREALLSSLNAQQPVVANEFAFPQAKAELLCDYIKVGNADQAIQVIDALQLELQEYSGYAIDAHRALGVQLLSFMLNRLNGQQPRAGSPLIPEEKLYLELMQIADPDSMYAWFRRMVKLASEEHSDSDQEDSKQISHIERLLQIIENNLAGELSLSSSAEALSLNPAYVSRLFKQTTGQTFMEYVTRIRMEKSKLLLAESEMKVGEIGRLVGYNQDYYFIRLFKEHTGVPPGEYRKRIRGVKQL